MAASWTAADQRRLDDALRAHPSSMYDNANARWSAIAVDIGKPARDCLARYKHVRAALKGTGESTPAGALCVGGPKMGLPQNRQVRDEDPFAISADYATQAAHRDAVLCSTD